MERVTGCLPGGLIWLAARLRRCPDFAAAGCSQPASRGVLSGPPAAAMPDCAVAPAALRDCAAAAGAAAS